MCRMDLIRSAGGGEFGGQLALVLGLAPIDQGPAAQAGESGVAHPAGCLGVATPPGSLAGTPGSQGTVTGTARIVLGPGDFARVRPGDILVCSYTDPGWTPLLRIAAGVITETGGVLSHAAIVARELRIPAVLGIPNATTRIPNAATITINGATSAAVSRQDRQEAEIIQLPDDRTQASTHPPLVKHESLRHYKSQHKDDRRGGE